jgi:hypothetical protein
MQHIRAWIDYSGRNAQLCFWRSRDGAEVDAVVYGESLFAAIEIKASARIKPQHLRGLKSFFKEYPECKPMLLHCGKERLLRTGFITISCRPGWLFRPLASFPSLTIALWAMPRSGALPAAKIAAPGLAASYETSSIDGIICVPCAEFLAMLKPQEDFPFAS